MKSIHIARFSGAILVRLALHRCGGGMELTFAADVSELFWSLGKPPLAALPFFIGC
jgi:hypothetical protein